jgi:hypothetical protein
MGRECRIRLINPDGSLYCEFIADEKMIWDLETVAEIEETTVEEAVHIVLALGVQSVVQSANDVKAEITAGMLNQDTKGGQA